MRLLRAFFIAIFVLFITSPAALSAPPEFTWLNQFAGLPEMTLRNIAPTSNGFVGSTGSRSIPMKFRAPDGTVECHVLIRYADGKWETTGDVGLASPPSTCGFLGGSQPVRDVTPFGTSICIGGDFTSLGPDALKYFACYNQAGNWLQVGGPGNGPNSTVYALAYDGSRVYLGGAFTSVNNAEDTNTSARHIIRTDGFVWERLLTDNAGTSDGVNGTVTAILPTTSFVYVGAGRGIMKWTSSINDKWSDLGSANNGTIRDIELNATNVASSASGATQWGGRPAGAISEYDAGTKEWSAVGSSSGISVGTGALAVSGGFFHSTGNFTSIDPDANGVARLNASNEWEAVPDAAALGDFPDFQDLAQVGSELCGTQQGFGTNQQFFSRGIACNNGQKWRGLAQGINNQVYDIIKYDSAIVAGGKFSAAGDQLIKYLAEYRNGAWSKLGGGLVFTGATASNPGDVRAMAVYKGDLYVMGLFNEADGKSTPGLARWDGQDWHAVGEGINFPGNVMLVWDGKLILTGTTLSDEGPILSWDGTTLAEFPDLPNAFRTPTAMAVHGGDLIAAYRPGSSAALLRWTGSTWEPFTDQSTIFGGDINAMIVRGSEVFVGGSFTARQGATVIGEQVAGWDGTKWAGLGDGLQGGFSGVQDLVFAGDGIIATGWFNDSGDTSLQKLGFYDGQDWFPLGPGLHNDLVGDLGNTLMIDGSTVYVGGQFDQAGNVWSENIGAFTIKLETVFESGFETN